MEGFTQPEGAARVVISVVSLYTSIPLVEAQIVIKETLNNRESLEPPTYFLLELTDILLDNIFFHFKDDFFLQIKGISMGTSSAPSLANLYMAEFKKQFIYMADVHPFFKKVL